jgi:glycosyltransferase involved in cell wall biosynthesis
MSSVFLSFANLFYRVPLVNGVLADAYANLNWRDKHYFRVKLTTPFSSVFVANSQAGIRAYRTPQYKSLCIYNGVDFGRFENLRPVTEIENEILGGPKNERLVMAMTAGFDDRKDYATLIKAAIKICEDRNDLIFLLIGQGPLLESLKMSVPQRLLNTQIIFTGSRSDIESILQIVDIGLLITYYEGVSNALIEYMAMGKPVIATEGGGTVELVKEGWNGLLIKQKDVEELVDKLKVLLKNKDRRQEMGQNAFHWVRKQFDVKDRSNQYIKLYKELLKEGKKTKNISDRLT